MKRNKIPSYLRLMAAILLGVLLAASGCKREAINDAVDPNNINNVIADNFNLSMFNTALKYSHQDRALKEQGPFTVLAPADAAFLRLYPNTAAITAADRGLISRLAQYHIIDGRFELNKLPFQFNQELRSRGGKMFVTRWIKGTDTVITINGARVLARNVPAQNGLVQVVNRVLNPYLHEKLGNAIAADATLTMFYQAILSSGMLETINGTGPYTILAPNNTAMQGLGYNTLEQVSNTNPETLKKLVNYHLIRDRRFVYDYILGSGTETVIKQNMADGLPITITLIADKSQPGGFGGIRVKGTANTADIDLVSQDMLTGNGVLHIIGSGLVSSF